MCTAATYKTKDFYFGRTLDYEISYGERVTVLPRNAALLFRHTAPMAHHYAMIGMTAGDAISGEYPLFYDGVNEKGLCMAGLNFVGNAVYRPFAEGKINLAHFEFVPWVLGQCSSVKEVRKKLQQIRLTDTAFSETLPSAALHWIIADREEAITVESAAEGLMVYDNPVGVLTNNPPFPMQMQRLNDYLNLTPHEPERRFAQNAPLQTYSRGMGALGLPGDVSSGSRFVRAAFTRMNSFSDASEGESVGQFFHILSTVEMVRGCCILSNGEPSITLYTCCCNADQGIYYYTTYENRCITAVDMHRESLDGNAAVHYPLLTEQQIRFQN